MPIKISTLLATDYDDDNNVPMSVAQATRFLGYKDVHVVLNLLNSGELKGHRIGRKWLIWRHDLCDFIAKRSNQQNGHDEQNEPMGGGGD
jgi:excisionase family DNA binding protein